MLVVCWDGDECVFYKMDKVVLYLLYFFVGYKRWVVVWEVLDVFDEELVEYNFCLVVMILYLGKVYVGVDVIMVFKDCIWWEEVVVDLFFDDGLWFVLVIFLGVKLCV